MSILQLIFVGVVVVNVIFCLSLQNETQIFAYLSKSPCSLQRRLAYFRNENKNKREKKIDIEKFV